jgi:REP element-mobilizing transposase RayT
MPRQARLDAPGTLHQVMGRGIEATKIFRNKSDREDFLTRLKVLQRSGALTFYAWALMPTHFHLLVRTGQQPLGKSMRRLLTGYAINFNFRHKRHGHLFQNRYKSVVCQEEPYLLELTRYIHLNPLRAGLVPDLEALHDYPWTGHATLMNRITRPWQETDIILSHFSNSRPKAIKQYEKFIRAGIAQGQRPELTGGGLIRSQGGWSQVRSLREKGQPVQADDRILGDGNFVERIWSEAKDRKKEAMRWKAKAKDLPTLSKIITKKMGISESELRSDSRKSRVSQARRAFCCLAVGRMGYSAAEVARFLGVTTSAVVRASNLEDFTNLEPLLTVS